MKIRQLFEMERYSQYLIWPSVGAAEKVAGMLRKRDGAEVEVEDNLMFFPDKFTFDHAVYHYKVKAPPGTVKVGTL